MTAQPQWVVDGNFDDAYDLGWGRANTFIWLDYPRGVVWLRPVRRNLGWWLSEQPTWSGNRMTLKMALSGIRHGLRGYGAKRRTCLEVLPLHKNVCVLRFRRPRDAAAWLAEL